MEEPRLLEMLGICIQQSQAQDTSELQESLQGGGGTGVFGRQFQCLAAMCLAQGWPQWMQVLREAQVRRLQDLPETAL